MSAHMVGMMKMTNVLDHAATVAQHATYPMATHGSSNGIFDMIARWVAHAAVWRVMDHLPIVAAVAVGVAAVVFLVVRSRRRSRQG